MPDSNAGDESTDVQLSLDAILDLLANYHRREMLRALRSAPDHTLAEQRIVNQLRERERDRTGVRPSRDFVEQTLHHVHAPKLSDAGVISYHEASEQYRYHPDETLEKWLDLIEAEHGSED